MRRTVLLSLFAMLAVGAARDARAQRRGGAGFGFSRGGHGYSRARLVSHYGFGYASPDYGFGGGYAYPLQPAVFIQQPLVLDQPPAPPAVAPPVNPVVTEYKWPAAGAASSLSAPSAGESEPESFVLVLKNGSTLSALMVFAADDGLHYVDPDERHLRISMSAVDRAATLRLNRARNLNLHLPAAQ